MHKFLNNFKDIPSSFFDYDGVSHESIEHYLFNCLNFINCRDLFFRSLLTRINITLLESSFLPAFYYMDVIVLIRV